jgi:uncharacterized protein
MIACDVAGLGLASIRRSAWHCCAMVLGVGLIGILWGGMLREGSFGHVRLAAWGVFLHGPLLLLGSAALLWRSKRGWAMVFVATAITTLTVAVDAFLIEPTWLEVSHVQITSAKVKHRTRIVVIADLQTDSLGKYEREVFRRARDEKPDIVLLAGDYLQIPQQQWQTLADELHEILREVDLTSTARVFAIRGNIDQAQWASVFQGLDIATIHNTQSFDLDGLRLTCLSLWDSINSSLQLPGGDPATFHVVLGHVPNFALGPIDADLLIAGHTHGGQVRLPIVGALTTNCRIPRWRAAGLTDLPGNRKLFVSRGIGMEREMAPPMRFLCRPELVVIELVPAE